METVLRAQPGVRDAAAGLREYQHGDQRLIAYIVPTGDPRPDSDELRTALARTLPDYMVPVTYVTLDALPTTPNGKLDREALPTPEQQGTGPDHISPRDPVEQVLAELFAKVLGVDAHRVGVHDNFFELGGHSLLATRLIAHIRSVLLVTLSPREVFERPTVAGLAGLTRDDHGRAPLPQIRRADRDGALPLSSGQERLWFMEQLRPGVPLHNMHWGGRLYGELDAAALRAALDDVVARHEILRTVFPTRRGRPEQLVLDTLEVPWDVQDARDWSESTVKAHVEEAVRAPFDLAEGPLLRSLLLRVGAREHLLVLAVHHVVFDAWSLGILLRELAHHYRARVDRVEPALPAMLLQYADFAAWQRSWLAGKPAAEQLRYWQNRLADAPKALELPTHRPRPAIQSHHGGYELVTVPADVMSRLREVCEREGVTLFMTLLTGFKIVLAWHAGVTDIVVGTPIANRNRVELESLIGFLVNTLPLRTDLAGDPTIGELLGRVRETCLDAYANQDLPFEQIVRKVAPGRDRSRAPVIQVMFAMAHMEGREPEFPGLTIEPLDISLEISRLDMSFIVGESASGLDVGVEYNVALFDQATIARILQDYGVVLRALADWPTERHLSDLMSLVAAR
ncbi:condensation domain-containing protein [Streptosporangium algeriense]|uniref:Condensation domain-containing protein n=1 Tax=Streptosporangium algeriense TaxID=1682748 RepID=A0ABW3DGX7_9ACTN